MQQQHLRFCRMGTSHWGRWTFAQPYSRGAVWVVPRKKNHVKRECTEDINGECGCCAMLSDNNWRYF